MLRLHPAVHESPPRNCRGATDPCSIPGRATLFRRRERRIGGRPSGKGKGATPRLWRIRRAGEFEEARVPSAPRCPDQAKIELFEEGASSAGKTGSGEWGVGSGGRKLLSYPHSPLPTPHSLFARSANLRHRGDVTAARRGGQRVAGHPHVGNLHGESVRPDGGVELLQEAARLGRAAR